MLMAMSVSHMRSRSPPPARSFLLWLDTGAHRMRAKNFCILLERSLMYTLL
ncbi:hypothetical protein HETIRDRAFT_173529 [Heterobasidion irregulare TC 32-1]|uniref:Uncharacterized protein n=1 Tax=Heterobasidion irregulare (strain TC 32-1) TaxID=747525 RepID=W4K7T3_HETIT|nr:uncharacterized protein HETIRDRAFT_173529 [Heterobasidion irregulare TC 32-1]ETW81848.1 hypothetical protein HETIRDRAFT_173529 [Heterobasidion irregulare TC 32-1]